MDTQHGMHVHASSCCVELFHEVHTYGGMNKAAVGLPWLASMARDGVSMHKAGPDWVSGSIETKTYGKSTLVREHEEQPTRPRRSLFGKDSDERARIFNALHMLFSSPEGLFSGKLSGTAIAGRW